MIKRILKIVGINFLVLLGLLIMADLAVITIYQGYQGLRNLRDFIVSINVEEEIVEEEERVFPRAELPNYDDIEWANQHFKEFREISSEYRSYFGWRRLEYSGKTVNIDSKGVRVTPHIHPIESDAPTAVFLGGSTMWGTGADDANTIPAEFAQLAQGNYEAVNFGESGFNALQGYHFLQVQTMSGFNPDIIISYDGVNQRGSFSYDRRMYSHSRENQIIERMRGADRSASQTQGTALSYRNYFVTPLEEFLKKIRNRLGSKSTEVNDQVDDAALKIEQDRYDLSEERIRKVAVELLESWMATKALADRHDAMFIAILQPNAAVGHPRLDHLEIDPIELLPYQFLYPKVLELLGTEKYSELNRHFLDLSDAFDSDDYIYIDFCHVSPNGNRIVAEIIYEYVEENRIIPTINEERGEL